jgi:hypothetical protein
MNPYIEKETAEIVNQLFIELQAIFPAFRQAWTSQQEFERAKIHWTKAFIDADLLRLEQLKHGIRSFRLLKSPFVPTSGQFIEMCRPSRASLNIPNILDAFKEASKNSHPCAQKAWSHEIVYHAWKNTGAYELRTRPEKEIYKLFEYNYEILIRKLLNGEILEGIKLAIEEKIAPIASKETGKDALNQLKSILGAK